MKTTVNSVQNRASKPHSMRCFIIMHGFIFCSSPKSSSESETFNFSGRVNPVAANKSPSMRCFIRKRGFFFSAVESRRQGLNVKLCYIILHITNQIIKFYIKTGKLNNFILIIFLHALNDRHMSRK